MAKIVKVDIQLIDLVPQTVRTDAIQSFVKQETPIVVIEDEDGNIGVGYSYTIGTGGKAIMQLLQETIIPCIIGEQSERVEYLWQKMLNKTHATSVGAITSLAIAAVDIALWDLNCKKNSLPLWIAAGGYKDSIPLYSTETGWLHLTTEELIDGALKSKSEGFSGTKIKIGLSLQEDIKRLTAVRKAVGDDYLIMTDANQSFSFSQALRYGESLSDVDVYWIEEPLKADDLTAHSRLCQSSRVPVAVGESMYSISQFKDYLQANAASIIQVDVARIGGITPWLKVAHLAEAYNVLVCPHFLMELHVSLVCAIPNGHILEYIPQLDDIINTKMKIENGKAIPSNNPGIGIDWKFDSFSRYRNGEVISFQI